MFAPLRRPLVLLLLVLLVLLVLVLLLLLVPVLALLVLVLLVLVLVVLLLVLVLLLLLLLLLALLLLRLLLLLKLLKLPPTLADAAALAWCCPARDPARAVSRHGRRGVVKLRRMLCRHGAFLAAVSRRGRGRDVCPMEAAGDGQCQAAWEMRARSLFARQRGERLLLKY